MSLLHVLFYIFYFYRDASVTNNARTCRGYEDVVLKTDATEIAVLVNLGIIDELLELVELLSGLRPFR